MDRPAFAKALQDAVVRALDEFRSTTQGQTPYAFALMPGQVANYLGYAVGTEERLREVAAEYAGKGYRYRGAEWEQFDNCEQLATWLRWANPDDGWHYRNFPDSSGITNALASLVECGAFGEDAEGLEEFCTETLVSIRSDPAWLRIASGDGIIVGVTSGESPRDYLRTATRANSFEAVRQLWAEYWLGEELSGQIERPSSNSV